jgi:hypothetical protein
MTAKVVPLQPKGIHKRIEEKWLVEMEDLLDQLHEGGREVPIRDRIMALSAIGRNLVQEMGLRKKGDDEPTAGSAVRKYSAAFTSDAARGRKAKPRPEPKQPAFEPDEFPDEFPDEDDAAS